MHRVRIHASLRFVKRKIFFKKPSNSKANLDFTRVDVANEFFMLQDQEFLRQVEHHDENDRSSDFIRAQIVHGIDGIVITISIVDSKY
jgi:hypothetical protein